jgi:hypothetical protein
VWTEAQLLSGFFPKKNPPSSLPRKIAEIREMLQTITQPEEG